MNITFKMTATPSNGGVLQVSGIGYKVVAGYGANDAQYQIVPIGSSIALGSKCLLCDADGVVYAVLYGDVNTYFTMFGVTNSDYVICRAITLTGETWDLKPLSRMQPVSLDVNYTGTSVPVKE